MPENATTAPALSEEPKQQPSDDCPQASHNVAPPRILKRLVYLSGPLTAGNTEAHVENAKRHAKQIAEAGYAVWCPHLSYYFNWGDLDYDHDFWMSQDFPMVHRCDYFVRIGVGDPSAGADKEQAYARELGKPSWTSVSSFLHEAPEKHYEARASSVYTIDSRGIKEELEPLSHFSSGAVRSGDASKYRFDLLSPIAMKAYLKHSNAGGPVGKIVESLRYIYNFLSGGGSPENALCDALQCIGGAMCEKKSGDQDIFVVFMHAAAAASEEGTIKYDAFNWEKGMPADDLLNHVIRHLLLAIDPTMGDADEDHLGHATWGLMAAIHSLKLWPHLNEGKFRSAGCVPPLQPTEQVDVDTAAMRDHYHPDAVDKREEALVDSNERLSDGIDEAMNEIAKLKAENTQILIDEHIKTKTESVISEMNSNQEHSCHYWKDTAGHLWRSRVPPSGTDEYALRFTGISSKTDGYQEQWIAEQCNDNPRISCPYNEAMNCLDDALTTMIRRSGDTATLNPPRKATVCESRHL